MEVVQVNRSVAIPVDELDVRTGPSGGPGGQHANRAHTRVEIHFDVEASPSLSELQRSRLLARLGPADARSHFESAIEFCAEVGNRPELALSRLGLAELLLDHYPDERDAAIEHLDFAIAEFREMKMQPSLERALRHRGLLKA